MALDATTLFRAISNVLKQETDGSGSVPIPTVKEPRLLDSSEILGLQQLQAEITENVAVETSRCYLFTGVRGSEITQALQQLQRQLEAEGLWVVYGDCRNVANLDDVDTVHVFVAIALFLSQQLPAEAIRTGQKLSVLLHHLAQFLLLNDISPQPQSELTAITQMLTQILERAQIDSTANYKLLEYLGPRINLFIELLNNELIQPAIAYLQRQGQAGLVVILTSLDGMERTLTPWGRERSEYVFVDRGTLLTQLACSLVCTVPLALVYGSDQQRLANIFCTNLFILPLIPPWHRDGSQHKAGLQLLQRTALMRVFPDQTWVKCSAQIEVMFDSIASLEHLCCASGGHLFLIWRWWQDWVKLERNLPLTLAGLEKVLHREANRLTYAINNEEWALLRLIHKTQQVVYDQPTRSLLRSRLVCHYRDAQGDWFRVNPLVADVAQLQR